MSANKKLIGGSEGPVEVLPSARVIRQPGDGSCLFHSLACGLADGSTAASLRKEIASFIEAHPELEISDSPLRDWIVWDSNQSVADYCAKMVRGSQWGGGIEMAAAAHLKQIHVLVYEQVGALGSSFKRIGSFGAANAKAVRVVYQGGVHFDALELHSTSHSVLGKSPGFSSHNGSGSILQPMGPSQHVDFMGRRGGATSSGGW